MIGADRGLAYDLRRPACAGAGGLSRCFVRHATATRRGAGLRSAWRSRGKKAEALSLLSPLMARGDAAGARTPRLRARADRRRGRRHERDRSGDARLVVANGLFLPEAAVASVRPEGGRGQSRHLPRMRACRWHRRSRPSTMNPVTVIQRNPTTERRSRRGPDRLDRALAVPGDARSMRTVPQQRRRPQPAAADRVRVHSAIAARSELRSMRRDLRTPQALDPARERSERRPRFPNSSTG